MKTIEKIHKQYGDMVFRLALTHLFNVGADRLLNADIDKECAALREEGFSNALMSGAMQAEIHRCAAALAVIDVWEIFKFIQTNIKINGVTSHPGKFLRFYDEDSGKIVEELVVPYDTCEGDIYDVVENINVKNIFTREMKAAWIRSAFRDKKIHVDAVPFDLTFDI